MREAVKPANDHQADIMLDKLMDRGFVVPDSVNPDEAGEYYAEVLRGKPIGAMRRVFDNLRFGRYPRYQSFLPKPAELSALIDDAAKHDREMLRLEREKEEREQERLEAQKRRKLTPEEQERRSEKVRKAVAELAKSVAEQSRGGGDDDES
ncbi:hypothetical protein [Martelella mediterranea]|uniref:Uncharacterized protein n=1 Tax=Martelella mediterranea TaxID=293089 RepID=A0A4R3P3R1_9HYPH|nr:hypothetical protein [Martelella mediterranea]TCT42765.1 hypothetical protein EDC90_100466 [Martelella mediterranea]